MSKSLFCVTHFRHPGNLPYTATKTAVESHLASVEPTAVRLMTMKDDPSRCKGFAFVEFARYDKMELCLTKFHHSIFNDGISDARKINVELT
jgi:nucleolar protein 6